MSPESDGETGGSLGRQAARGTLWLVAQKWVARISGLATIAILARLIEPSEFGVVAAATAVMPLILLLADLGFSTYVVQLRDISQRILSTGFWFSVAAGIVLGGALLGLAPLIAAAFRLSEAVPVLRAMAVSVLFVVLASVPGALLRRRMKFRLLAMQSTAATLVAQVVAVVLALRGAGVWALVVQLLVSQAIVTVLAWRAAHWMPSFQFSRTEFVAQARFGAKIASVDLIGTLRQSAEAAIIAAVLGGAALGYLSIAQRLIQVTQDLGAAALVPVSTVVFAKVRESKERLRTSYLKALKVSYAAVSPVMTFVAVGSPLLVPMIFGDAWGNSVPVAQALALAAILTLGAMLDKGLFYGSGKPGSWLIYAIFVDALTLIVTAVVAPYGLTAVAIGFVGVAWVATMARWVTVSRFLGASVRTLIGIAAKAACAVFASAAVGVLVIRSTDGWSSIGSLTVVGISVAATHVLVVRLMSPDVIGAAVSLMPMPGGLRPLVFRLAGVGSAAGVSDI